MSRVKTKYKIVSDNDNVYSIVRNPVDDTWDVSYENDSKILFNISASEDVSKDELVAEIDFWELTKEDDSPSYEEEGLYEEFF